MAYLESVDNALRLMLLLSDGRRVTVTGVAQDLGVAPSTAHRLLSTLMYRQFAVQGSDRAYSAGPSMLRMGRGQDSRACLVEAARPFLVELTRALDESSHVGVLVNRHMHFLASEDAEYVRAAKDGAREPSRDGNVLPAHQSAGGKALLAGMRADDFESLYPASSLLGLGMSAAEMSRLREELEETRRRGYAVNRSAAERNNLAFAMPVPGFDGTAAGALVVTVPSARYTAARLPQIVSHLRSGVERITNALKQPGPEIDIRPRK